MGGTAPGERCSGGSRTASDAARSETETAPRHEAGRPLQDVRRPGAERGGPAEALRVSERQGVMFGSPGYSSWGCSSNTSTWFSRSTASTLSQFSMPMVFALRNRQNAPVKLDV